MIMAITIIIIIIIISIIITMIIITVIFVIIVIFIIATDIDILAVINCHIIIFIFLSHSEYVKITDGVGTEVLHRRGCAPFATENLLDVQFGSSGNISVQVYLENAQSSLKIKFAVLKNGISSGMF